MISIRFILSLCTMAFCLSACFEEFEEDDSELAPTPSAFLTVSDSAHIPVNPTNLEIETDENGRPIAYRLLGNMIPEFSAKLSSGGQITQADLKDRWTIVNFWGLYCHDSLADASYANALKNALESDPDVGYLSIHTAPKNVKTSPKKTKLFGQWESIDAYFKDKGYTEYPVALDLDASIRNAFNIEWTPSYLLIGPDLTVEAFRTDLSLNAQNGIKDVVQQIHEIRKNSSQATGRQSPSKFAMSSAPASTISSVGVAGLSGPTLFDLWAVRQAFDGYDVFTSKSEFLDKSQQIYEVHSADGLVMRILADETGEWVGSAIAVSREFKGPLGETIGVSLLGDMPKDILGECSLGENEYANSFICKADTISHFERVFNLPSEYNPLLDEPLLSEVINAAKLSELRFLPDNRAS